MYGFINHIVQQLVLRKFGEPTWEKIRDEAGETIVGLYPMLERYDDASTYTLIFTAEKLLNVPASIILELFGEMFYIFCTEAGYSDILRALAPTPIGFLESLDTLHDHLGSVYVGMRAPSFRCTREEGVDGAKSKFYLHYYSHRAGLSPVVIGVVKTACWDIFRTKAALSVVTDRHLEEGEVCFEVQMSTEDGAEVPVAGPVDAVQVFAMSPKMGQDTFALLFPFHILFNRQLRPMQVGTVIARLFPALTSANPPNLDEIFEIERPKLPFTYSAILGHINTPYVLMELQPPKGRKGIRLKGQMSYQYQDDLIMYFCSPSVAGIQQMQEQGLTLNDIPVHDSTKSLVVMNEHFSAEYELSHELELMTNFLQLRYRDVEVEKQKTENLIYAAFPPSIVEDMKKGRDIPSRAYKQVTIMFTGIKNFAEFCVNSDPIDIVDLLNDCYTAFDNVLDPDGKGEVYKVETIADHYMCVSGCPEERPDHTRPIAELAIRLMRATKTVFYKNGKVLEITAGINSGEIVAGIIGKAMPRFCLFGDTVNTTSRCESFGRKGYVNMTQASYEYLQIEGLSSPDFQFTFHANVPMKGKPAPVTVWMVDSKADPACPIPEPGKAEVTAARRASDTGPVVQKDAETASVKNSAKELAASPPAYEDIGKNGSVVVNGGKDMKSKGKSAKTSTASCINPRSTLCTLL